MVDWDNIRKHRLSSEVRALRVRAQPDSRGAGGRRAPRWVRHEVRNTDRFLVKFARLFTEVFQRDLDSFIVHLLVLGTKLFAAIGGAVEKLDHHTDR